MTYDPEADAAYIYFDADRSMLAATIELEGHSFKGDLLVDVDEDGVIVGLEVLGARALLPRELLAAAELPDQRGPRH